MATMWGSTIIKIMVGLDIEVFLTLPEKILKNNLLLMEKLP
jgi:hypothetical protein